MDGSQLPTEWTHLKEKIVSGVSDSKMRDVSHLKKGIRTQGGPMTKNVDDSEVSMMTKMSDASKKSPMAEKVESTTNRQSEKSSLTFGGDNTENVENGLSKKPIRVPTPTPEKKPEVHRTSNDRQENPFPVPHPNKTGEVNKMGHLGGMPHCDTLTRENLRFAGHDSDSHHVTKEYFNQQQELSKEEREQALAECRKRCGIVPGQIAVPKDPSSQLVEQP